LTDEEAYHLLASYLEESKVALSRADLSRPDFSRDHLRWLKGLYRNLLAEHPDRNEWTAGFRAIMGYACELYSYQFKQGTPQWRAASLEAIDYYRQATEVEDCGTAWNNWSELKILLEDVDDVVTNAKKSLKSEDTKNLNILADRQLTVVRAYVFQARTQHRWQPEDAADALDHATKLIENLKQSKQPNRAAAVRRLLLPLLEKKQVPADKVENEPVLLYEEPSHINRPGDN
jgi:hypothetical protein